VSPYASAGAGNHDTAEEWVSSGARVEISTDIMLLSNLVVADAWGELTITEDAPETVQVGISTLTDGFSFLAQVSLDAAGGGNVFSIEGNGYEDPPDLLIPLSPGQYKLTWSTEGGTGSGYGSSYFTIGAVPEPSAGLLFLAPAAVAFTRRRRTTQRRPLIAVAALILAITLLGPARAGAAVTVTDGTLHTYVSNADSPSADQPFVAPQTDAQSYSPGTGYWEQVFGGGGEGGIDPGDIVWYRWVQTSPPLDAYESVSFADGQIGISTTTDRGSNSSAPVVEASGSLRITEDELEITWVHIDPTPYGAYYRGQVSLHLADGASVFDTGPFSSSTFSGPRDFLVSLTPGQYTLSWSAEGHSIAPYGGSGGYDDGYSGGFQFTMGALPEPSSGLLIIAPAAMPLLRRRRQT
jgi:hypothetical protein